MKIGLFGGGSGTGVGLRDGLCYGVLMLMALVAGAAQARQQKTAPAQQPNQQASRQPSQQGTQSQESQPQTKTEQGSTPRISMDVKTVSVQVTVRDKHGKIISDLNKQDFSVDEDG